MSPSTLPSDADRIIALQVGEQHYTSTSSTLTRNSKFFSWLLTSSPLQYTRGKDTYFIDTDPFLFDHILRFLRTGAFPVFYDKWNGHDHVLYQDLAVEAEFFGIDSLTTYLQDREYMQSVTARYTVREVIKANPALPPGISMEREYPADAEMEFHTSWTTAYTYLCPRGIECHRGRRELCGWRCRSAEGYASLWDEEEVPRVLEIRKFVDVTSKRREVEKRVPPWKAQAEVESEHRWKRLEVDMGETARFEKDFGVDALADYGRRSQQWWKSSEKSTGTSKGPWAAFEAKVAAAGEPRPSQRDPNPKSGSVIEETRKWVHPWVRRRMMEPVISQPPEPRVPEFCRPAVKLPTVPPMHEPTARAGGGAGGPCGLPSSSKPALTPTEQPVPYPISTPIYKPPLPKWTQQNQTDASLYLKWPAYKFPNNEGDGLKSRSRSGEPRRPSKWSRITYAGDSEPEGEGCSEGDTESESAAGSETAGDFVTV